MALLPQSSPMVPAGVAVVLAMAVVAHGATYPLPFTRELALTHPYTSGKDVYILQNLLRRKFPTLNVSREYDEPTELAVHDYNAAAGIPTSSGFSVATAVRVLAELSEDHYVDDGQSARSRGYMYKVTVPVHRNRSVETTATLLDADNNVLHTFTVRTHGHVLVGDPAWPDFNNIDPGRNEFSSSGNTPTGLMEFDLNSPEDVPRLYGPYPVNRAVQGVEGNAAFLMPTIRNGILLHTGEWPNWTPADTMPNSEGCLHAHPDDIKAVWEKLVALGVQVNDNPFGKLPYPYKCQGLLSVWIVDA